MDETTRRVFAGELIGGGVLLSSCGFAYPRPQLPVVQRKDWQPAYVSLERSGELKKRAQVLQDVYRECRLCPRACGVNRLKGETGVCRSAARAKVYSAHAHFGEERPLVGRGGSGTIFFSHCNLLCEFCQNWEINHRGDGSPISHEELGRLMLGMQDTGCHNINLVTPTHYLPSIVQALRHAISIGLRVPVVYNCGGYEPVEIIRLLDGIVDIYLPDFKYMDGSVAGRLSRGAVDYPEAAKAAIQEMHRQVGLLTVDERGIALRGLLIRHLVLPGNLAGTDTFVRWVAGTLGTETYVNIMGQYRPAHRASRYPEISRRVTAGEHAEAVRLAREAGLTNIDS
jgi:putative pyruvate formate lyase activating enzyme